MYPWVVEAVTLTTMMVALVRICCRFSLFLHLSRLLPSSCGQQGSEGEARSLRRALDLSAPALTQVPSGMLESRSLYAGRSCPTSSENNTAQVSALPLPDPDRPEQLATGRTRCLVNVEDI